MTLEDIFNPAPEGADAPVAGTYQLLLRARPPQPVRILFGPPYDPLTGDIMDRGWRWQMLINGRPAIFCEEERDDLAEGQKMWSDVWPQCSASPIPYSEYRFLVAEIGHAEKHDLSHPFAAPHRRVNLDTAALPF